MAVIIEAGSPLIPRGHWRPCPAPFFDEDAFLGAVRNRSVVASRPENQPLNRYSNILPFDDNRCVLGEGGYINASPIALLPGGRPCHIASQGPLEHTIWDFLRLLNQEEIGTLVQLTEHVEDGRPKCATYLPEPGEEWREGELVVSVGPWTTLVEVRGQRSCLRERDLRIVSQAADSGGAPLVQGIKHLHYQHWPDHGAPDLGLLLHLVRRGEELGGRILAHCSAGVGRTGTFFGAMALSEARRGGIDIDPVDVILHLRAQRMYSVQGRAQPWALQAFNEDYLGLQV